MDCVLGMTLDFGLLLLLLGQRLGLDAAVVVVWTIDIIATTVNIVGGFGCIVTNEGAEAHRRRRRRRRGLLVLLLVLECGGGSNGDDDEVEDDVDVKWR